MVLGEEEIRFESRFPSERYTAIKRNNPGGQEIDEQIGWTLKDVENATKKSQAVADYARDAGVSNAQAKKDVANFIKVVEIISAMTGSDSMSYK